MLYVWLSVLVVGLAALGIAFAIGQVRTLRWVRGQKELAREDVRYFVRRSYSRLVGSALLLLLAGLLAGLHGFGVLEGLDALVAEGPQAQAEQRQLTPEQRRFVDFAYGYVGAIALVVLLLVVGSFLDTMATRRYGMRHRKQIREDRQAMLARQFALLQRRDPGCN